MVSAYRGTNNVAIVDSYFSDFHCTSITGSCTEAHALEPRHRRITQDGPYKIAGQLPGSLGPGHPVRRRRGHHDSDRHHDPFQPLLQAVAVDAGELSVSGRSRWQSVYRQDTTWNSRTPYVCWPKTI